jgi:signal transduction histidine kinase
MNFLGILSFVIAFVNIFLGVYVLIKNPKNKNNQYYALAVWAIAIWCVTTFFYNNPIWFGPRIWLIIVYIASFGMLISQALLVYVFPERSGKNFWIIFGVIIFTIIPSFYVLIIKDSVVLTAFNDSSAFRSYASMGPDYWIYIIPNVLGITLLSVYFFIKGRRFTGFNRIQIQYYTIGALMMMLPVVVIDYFIPLFFDYTGLYVYGPIFVVPFTVSVGYSIIQNRFVGMKDLVFKVLVLLEETVFFVLAFLGLFYYVSKVFESRGLFMVISFVLVAAPLLIMIFRWYTKIFAMILRKLVLKQERSAEEILSSYARSNSVELDTDKISINVRTVISELFNIKRVGIMLLDSSNKDVLYKYMYEFNINEFDDLLEIIHYGEELGKNPIIITDEIKREVVFGKQVRDRRLSRILYFLDKHKISAILPLNKQAQLNGVMVLGYKDQQIPLSVEEIEQLDILISQTSVAMGRSLLYKEVEDFNASLKQKVSEQTFELQKQVKELEEARRKEADMIDIMGHELRTPMSIVKLNSDMLTQFTDKIFERKEDFVKYVDRIKESVETEIKLINTLLSSAKLEGDKIELNPEKIDIAKQIETSMHANELDARRKGLKLQTDFEPNTPHTYSDLARTVEILNNLISNAVKYTNQGSITVRTETEGDFVRISVIDTGEGIAREDLEKLGTKFYRTGNYIKSENQNDNFDIVRPGGTGLGLYVTFNLVKKMGGEISVFSNIGKGSNFTFTLPMYTNQDEGKNKDLDSNDMFSRMGLKR